MFRNRSILELKGKEDRIHRYDCPCETPLTEVRDAIHAMLNFVEKLIEKRIAEAEEEEQNRDNIPEKEKTIQEE